MAYMLSALLAEYAVVENAAQPLDLRVVALQQDIGILPLTEAVNQRLAVLATHWALVEEKRLYFSRLSAGVVKFAVDTSAFGLIGYVEIESFGGVGYQSVIAWDGAVIAFGPHKTSNDPDELAVTKWDPPVYKRPVNRLLRRMGGVAQPGTDEFETVGLGQFRSTDVWGQQIEEAGNQID